VAESWRLLASRRLVDDRWLKLDAETLETTRGTVLDPWYLVRGLPWSCAVATVPDGRLVLVEQYRRGVDAWVLEIPAGVIDAGEDPAATAARELEEESGHRAITPAVHLGSWFPEPAHSTTRAHGYFMRADGAAAELRQDAGEDIRVVLLPLPEVDAAIASGRFCHGVQIGFLLRARALGLL
jgi:8-oxo-dGTP pyrophosphatase MutT (NUDIX family)